MAAILKWTVCGLGIIVSCLWLIQVLALWRHRKAAHWLADLPDSLRARNMPGLTVILAARDEGVAIEGALRSILGQDYPGLNVVAVDDRSSDATGTILDRLAAEDSRLRVVHIGELPRGWLGKTHALHFAARDEASPWLLFTDADVTFAPGTLRRAVAWAQESGADHVTVVPEFVTEGVGERLFHMIFALAFASRVLGGRIGPAGGRTHLGIGAFNLVRLTAFRGIGGFAHLALSVDDDNRLAQALKLSGYRGRAILGKGAVSVRWHTGLFGLIRGLEKNLFAMVDFRTTVVVVAGLLWLGMCAPYVGLFVGPWSIRIICGAGIVSIAVILSAMQRQTGIAWYYALAMPVGVFLYLYAFSRSACLTLWRQSVRWRGQDYPLSELREHVLCRNAWLRSVQADVQRRQSKAGQTHDQPTV
jgi:cellulose synthase/poly-beta-1,6-N-acetylglucosamine synthase-like glycosyltransferase